MAKIVWVFDLEGPLVLNMPYQELLDRVATVVGTKYQELLGRYLDKKIWQGVEPEKEYHLSLAKSEEEKEAIRKDYEEFYEGSIALKGMPGIVPGAKSVLMRLRDRGDRLICWTRGEESLQKKILAQAGLDSFFEEILIVSHKNRETVNSTLLPAVGEFPFIMVGDSYQQDIEPVLLHALASFWVKDAPANRYGTLKFIDNPNVFTISNVSDINKYLDVSEFLSSAEE